MPTDSRSPTAEEVNDPRQLPLLKQRESAKEKGAATRRNPSFTTDEEHEARLARLCKNPPAPIPRPEIVPASIEAEEAVSREVEEARRVGYTSRLLVQATLPHSKPGPEEYVFQRSNGYVSLKIIADPAYGLPYGTYPRLILAFITAEAVRTKSPIIRLGGSLRQFLKRMNLDCSGGAQGSAPRLREHMRRLFTATIAAEWCRDGEWHRLGFSPVEKVSMFWDPKNPEKMTGWHATIQLNQSFFEEITRQPVPVDMAALHGLGLGKNASSMALDIYQWLTHRFSYLREPVTISWESLQLQLGGDYKLVRQFRAKFLQHLKVVLKFYPQAKVEAAPQGLLLSPSKTHVPMRLVTGKAKK